ncbi:hypothetical protein Avbf_02479 [Armadillidium vulgare]|nr:hypothetical protein Avbf_02479 [Armadillidium vulgare]
MKKMAIGHHIEDRSHVIEKEMAGDGAVEEKEEFVNLDETEAESFNNEFRRKTQQVLGAIEQHPRPHRATTSPSRQRYLPALPSSSYRRRTRPMLALTSGSSRANGEERAIVNEASDEQEIQMNVCETACMMFFFLFISILLCIMEMIVCRKGFLSQRNYSYFTKALLSIFFTLCN